MTDALGRLRANGYPFPRIERSSERPGASGFVLDRGRFYALPQPPVASDALSPRSASPAPSDPVFEVDRVTQPRGLMLVGGRWCGVGAHIAELDGDD